MTDLSPAAQAVLEAFKSEVELTWLTKDPDRVGLAAALRAVAEHLRPDPGQSYQMGGIRACQRQLLAIADELEGTP